MQIKYPEYPVMFNIYGFHTKENLQLSRLWQDMLYEAVILTVHALPEFLIQTLKSIEINLHDLRGFSICFSFKGETGSGEWQVSLLTSALFRLIPDVNAEKIKEMILSDIGVAVDKRLAQEREWQAGLSGALEQLRSK